MRQRPVRTDAAVFYPYIGILVRKRIVRQGVLSKDARMWLTVMVHDVTLVVHHILDSYRRGYHLPRGTIVIERSPCQRHNSHCQFVQFRVVNGRMCAQRTTKLRIQVIFVYLCAPGIHRTFHQQLHSTVAQQPDADISQIEVVLQQRSQRFGTGFLEHHLQNVGCTLVTDKHPVVFGDRRIQPQAVANHIGIGNLSDALGSPDIYITADYHCRQPVWSLCHHTLVERQL